MEKAYRILAINPGSTSTKIAIFTNEEMTFSRELKHSAEDLKDFHHINDQLDFRLQAVLTELKKDGHRPERVGCGGGPGRQHEARGGRYLSGQ